MSKASEMYKRLTEQTDPYDPVVADEILRGIRHPYGITDVHDHLPRFKEAAEGNILEIGVRHGASTCAFLAGVEENGGHVYSVDIEDCSQLFSGHPQWTFIQGDSKDKTLKGVLPDHIDVLYIDGDHSYEGVMSDLLCYVPMAHFIMVHDANENENPGVLRAVREYATSYEHDLTIIPESHGLAIII
jgi:predicted O-methyltransferase YrrM